MSILRLGSGVDDLKIALRICRAACDLSGETCSQSFQVLAKMYESLGDPTNELDALKRMFAVPLEVDNMPTAAVQNERRELGFRLHRLLSFLNADTS